MVWFCVWWVLVIVVFSLLLDCGYLRCLWGIVVFGLLVVVGLLLIVFVILIVVVLGCFAMLCWLFCRLISVCVVNSVVVNTRYCSGVIVAWRLVL